MRSGIAILTHKTAQPELLELIAKRTGRALSEIEQATLTFENILVSGKIAPGRSQWVMQLGIYHRTHRNLGLSFCPTCLNEDEVPYFRRSWRLAFSVICVKHRIKMHDCCPQCGAAVTFFRHDFKDKSDSHPLNMAECYYCNYDLRLVQPTEVKDTIFLNFISNLESILQTGIAYVNDKPIYSFLYFNGIRQLFKLITLDRYGIKLRNAIENQASIIMSPFLKNKHQISIETLPISVRSDALKLVCILRFDRTSVPEVGEPPLR